MATRGGIAAPARFGKPDVSSATIEDPDGKDRARISRGHLPDRPTGVPERLGCGQRRQHYDPAGCRAHPGHADRRVQGHDAPRRPDHRRHEGQQDPGPGRAHQRDRDAHDGVRPAAGHPRRGARASAGGDRLRDRRQVAEPGAVAGGRDRSRLRSAGRLRTARHAGADRSRCCR